MKNLVIGFLFIYFWCEVLAKTIDSKELSVKNKSDNSDMQLLPLEDQVAETKKSQPDDKTDQRDQRKMNKVQTRRTDQAKTFLDDEEEEDDVWSEMMEEIWKFVVKGMQRMVSGMAGMAAELMGS